MSDIETTEADPIEVEVMESEAPQPKKKTIKKAATAKAQTATDRARDAVKRKLETAGRPNKDDMLDRLAHDN
jgi:hypothetical protein